MIDNPHGIEYIKRENMFPIWHNEEQQFTVCLAVILQWPTINGWLVH